MRQGIFWILFTSCQEKTLPKTNANDQTESTETTDSVACVDAWEEGADSIWYDPVTCSAWSPPEGPIDWHQSVSHSEAVSGGCASTCDEDTEQDHCANLSLGGLSNWRVPSIAELEDLATRSPPFEAIEHDLWSIDSDSMDNLAWTANIDQPGMSVLLEKSSEAYVRCIAD